jgi:hypothetical protein
MTTTPKQEMELLAALFSLAQHDIPADLDNLTDALCRRLDSRQMWQLLGRLEARGLVDRARMRLTFIGLAVATALKSEAAARSIRRAA